MNGVKVMSANEAAARGAVEAGISVATSYPGEPVSSVIHYIAEVAKQHNIYVEWSVNEKVAYELALGASFMGLRALTVVKHVGFNWILDPFAGSAFSGVGGGLVVIVGDDPGGRCSTSEEDTRYLTELTETPLLEPSTPQETKEMVSYAFDLSEEISLPVVVRLVTRLCDQKGPVTLGPIRPQNKPYRKMDKRVVIEARYGHHEKLGLKNRRLREISESSPFNVAEVREEAEIGVVGCGFAAQLVNRLPDEARARVALFKVGMVRPLPENKVRSFASKFERILIVEEVQPFLENAVRQALREINVQVCGRLTGHLPWGGELRPEDVARAVGSLLGVEIPEMKSAPSSESDVKPPTVVQPCPRSFHPRCPHRFALQALRSALKQVGGDSVVAGDVGCMSLDFRSRDSILDTMIAMGSSIGVAAGIKLSDPKRNVVAVIGDSSFYHDGIQGLLDVVYHQIPIVILILDNRLTAQTGFQPDPGSGVTVMKAEGRRVLLEELLLFLGGKVKVVDAFNREEVEAALVEALKSGECRVVISRGLCPLAEEVGAYSSGG